MVQRGGRNGEEETEGGAEWCRGEAEMERKGRGGSRVVQRGGRNGEDGTDGGAEWCRGEAGMERKGQRGGAESRKGHFQLTSELSTHLCWRNAVFCSQFFDCWVIHDHRVLGNHKGIARIAEGGVGLQHNAFTVTVLFEQWLL